jgi:polar amino acid transport system substrate-binding protein
MKGIIIRAITLFLLLFSSLVTVVPAIAKEVTPRPIKEITLAVGMSIPPYIDSENQSGIELEIISEAFAEEGYGVQLRYLGNYGIVNNFNAGLIESMLVNRSVIISEEDDTPPRFSSDTIIHYHNYALSLKKYNHQVNNIEELSNLRVMGFCNATKVLEPEFALNMSNSPLYREVSMQTDQVIALYRDLVDVVIADLRIFNYFQKKIKDTHGEFYEVKAHDVFQPSPRQLVFAHHNDRDSFNRGLHKLKASGRYQAILTNNTEAITVFTN